MNIGQRQGMVIIKVEKAVLIQYQIAIALESGLHLAVDLVLDFWFKRDKGGRGQTHCRWRGGSSLFSLGRGKK